MWDDVSPTILEDLAIRFIVPIPSEEKKNSVRVLFQVELAHWFYLDDYVKRKRSHSLDLRRFAHKLLLFVPETSALTERMDEAIEEWEDFKYSIPTFGCILVDEIYESVLLVLGRCKRSSWTFPKGKINEGEEPTQCAVREVWEEIGFDCTQHLKENLFLQKRVFEKQQERRSREERLYIILGVSRDTRFHTRTEGEIRNIEWFRIADLPIHERDPTPQEKLGMDAVVFKWIIPFVPELRECMARRRFPLIRDPSSLASVSGCAIESSERKSSELHPQRVKVVPRLIHYKPTVPFFDRRRSRLESESRYPRYPQADFSELDDLTELRNPSSVFSICLCRKLGILTSCVRCRNFVDFTRSSNN